jgi:hypothetical protein
MIVCVWERPDDADYSRVVFMDTGLAVTVSQKKYVSAIERAVSSGEKVEVPEEISLMFEEDDEVSRMLVDLPQRVEAYARIDISAGAIQNRKR